MSGLAGAGRRRSISALAFLAILLTVSWADVAEAYSTGITGRTNKQTGAGCGSCHSPTASLGVSISGDATVAAGASSSYSVNISGAANSVNIGVNIAASDGTLSESAANLYVSGGEITHTGTLANTGAGTTGSYSFTYTVPAGAAVGSTHTLYAAARAGGEWDHATNFVITVPKLNQTITFPAQTSPRTYSTGATFSISPVATATSGLAITYTSDTPTVCTTPGTTSTTVTMQGAGLCTIRANQNGNSNYNAANDVMRSITINKGNQTVTFGSQVVFPSYSPGGTFNLAPAASASSGLAIVYVQVTPSICTKASSGIVVGTAAAGACQVQATQPGNVDWNAAPILASHTRTINIAKGTQTITFPVQANKNFVLNGTFTLSGVSASSGLAVTYTSLTPTVCTTPGNTTNLVTMLDNGTCTVEASQAGNTNYNPAVDVSGDILLTETPVAPATGTAFVGNARTTITFGSGGNGNSVTAYTATCIALGQTTRTGTSTTPSSPIVVLGLTNGIQYSCTVTATNAFGTGPASSPAELVTPSAATVVPVIRSSAGFTLNVGTTTTFRVVSTGTPDATFSIGGVALPSGVSYISNAINPKVPAGTLNISGTPAAGTVGTYSLTFSAINTACGGTFEPACPVQNFTLTIAKGNPAITFPVPADRPYSPAPFALAGTIATSNSTLAASNIVYTSATPLICGISGANVTMLATGTCTINANSTTAAAYTASYNAAPQVQRSFVISKGSQTITFDAATTPVRTYAPGLSWIVSPLATASSGLAVSYASTTTGVCTLAGTTVSVVGAGTCIIEASQDGNALYLAAPDAQQTTTINPAGQSINFGAQAAQPFVPGGTFAINPLASATSGLAVDYTSTTPAVCTASGTNVQIQTTGVCGIQASQQGDANYAAATPVVRNVTINAVPPGAPTLDDTLVNDGTIRLYFTPPASNGGAAITAYRGTCNPGNVSVMSTDSPVVVGGLTNNVQYTCTVTAQNSTGFGAASAALDATPILRTGTVLWDAVCANCHSSPPSAARFNAAGDTGAVIQYVRANQPDMLAVGVVQALTANELANIAQYIKAQMTPITANALYVTPLNIDVGPPLHIYLGGVAFTDVEVVTPPTKGNLSLFTGTVATYTPGLGFDGADSFTYRGMRTSPSPLLGEPRTVSITIGTPAIPVITSLNTANGVFGVPFNYQITATNSPSMFGATGLGGGVSVNPANGLLSGTPTAAGIFNVMVSATNPGGTGNQTVQLTISPASQSITFPAQSPSTQPFSPGGTFPVNPLGSAPGGAVAYSSLTPGVCTISGGTVTKIASGTCTIAANQSGNANYNAALQVTQDVTITATVPGAPTIGTATPGDTQAAIAFTPNANNGGSPVTIFNASCAPSGSGSNTVSPIAVSGLTNGVQYTCSVTATNAAGISAASGTVMVTPQNTPVAPQITSANGTTFTVLSAGTFNVTASGVPLPTMSLFSGTLPTGVTFNASPGTGTSTLGGTPAAGTAGSYPLVFRATATAPVASQSFTLTVAKANQSINFANPGATSYSLSAFALTASATSGLAVAFTSNTPSVCTVAGNNVTTVTTGVCSISANQAGNADYNAANQVTQGFSINAAAQTITFSAQVTPRNFNSNPFALSPVAFSTSGLAIIYSTTTPSVCAMSGNNVATLSAGLCTIAANQPGNANYAAATQVTQSLTINAILPSAPTIGVATGSDQQVTINFTPPASNGGSALTFTATCIASGQATRTGSNSASPVMVSNLVNGIPYTCSVTATNSAGTGPASGTVMVTPTSADGAGLWAAVCDACHTSVPSGSQLNGAGSTAAVLEHVRTQQPLMAIFGPVQALNAAELAAIAAYIGNNLAANEVTTAFNTPAPIDVSGHISFTGQAWSAFTAVEVVTPPGNGMVSVFTGTSATYTPNPGFSGVDTFTYRGKRSAPNITGDPVQVTVTVLAGAPVVSSAGTANGTFGQAFSYQIIASGSPMSFGASGLPPGITADTVTGAVSGTAQAAGTFNATITATNAGGTGSLPLTITIAQAGQTILFAAQSTPTRSFVPGDTFTIAPLATGGGSGNLISYSTLTPSVCTVNGTTITMVAAGTCTLAANQAGNADYSAAPQVTQNIAITATVPGIPAIGTATPGNAQALVGFAAPSQTGGSPILDYTATCIANAQPTRTGTGTVSPLLVASLVNDVAYACSVTARNVAGNSAASAIVNVTPALVTVPGAPIIGLAIAGNGSASLAFSPPVNNGGAIISQYTATCNPGGIAASGSTSPVVVNGLANGVTYTCSVTATNSAGPGPASATVDVTPEAPLGLVAVQSRKTHGAVQGDIAILPGPITGPVTVEPRSIGAGHRIVFQFDNTVTGVNTVSAVNALSAPLGSATASYAGNELTITLTGIPDNTRVTVTAVGVNGAINASASIGFLVGDVTNSRSVNAADVSAVKARAGAGAVDAATFVYDLNADGVVTSSDISAVKARSGIMLP